MSVDTACISTDNADSLIFTGSYTATAEDTFIVISYHVSSGVVELINGLEAVVFVFCIYTVLFAKLLKLTVTASDTGEALSFMSGKDELESSLSCFTNLFAVSENFCSVSFDGEYTGSYEASCTLYF